MRTLLPWACDELCCQPALATEVTAGRVSERGVGDSDSSDRRRPPVHIRESDVDWDPTLVRLECVDSDGVPIRTSILSRLQADGDSRPAKVLVQR